MMVGTLLSYEQNKTYKNVLFKENNQPHSFYVDSTSVAGVLYTVAWCAPLQKM